MTYFDEVDGVLWARGDDFKASFGDGAMTFIPFLGSDAPRNFPVTFRLESVHAGAELARLGAVRVSRSGSEVSIDHGAVIEVEAIAPDQIEQSFRFDASPGTGDVIVRIAVDTELSPRRAADGALEFVNDEGGVHYGRPVVVDAGGRRQDLDSRWREGGIEFLVPESFLTEAKFPVIVDPVLFAFSIAAGGPALQDFKPDATYDLSTDRFGIVYEEVYSATDHDVFFRAVDGAGTTVVSGYVDFTSNSWTSPKIANNRLASQFLVVAEKTVSSTTSIAGRTVQAASASMGAQFQISGPDSANKGHPDVGGDPGAVGPTYYCVCWHVVLGSVKNVYYNAVTTSSTLLFGAYPLSITPAWAGSNVSKPSISKSNGVGNASSKSWAIAYQATTGSSTEAIMAATILPDGTEINFNVLVSGWADYDTDPAVSSPTDEVNGIRRRLFVYQKLIPGNPPFSSPQYDLMGALDTGSGFVTANLTSLLGVYGPRDQVRGSVDTDGTRFAVGFTESGGLIDLATPYVGTVDVVGGMALGVTEPAVSLNAYNGYDDDVRVASKRSGGGPAFWYMTVHDVQSLSNSSRNVVVTHYDGWSPAANGNYLNHVGPGCGGLSLSVMGFPALGNPITLTLSGVQGVPLIAVGSPITPTVVCSGCILMIDPNTATIFQASSLSGTVPPEGGLVNSMIAVQGADVGSSTGCPGSPPLSLSDSWVITIL